MAKMKKKVVIKLLSNSFVPIQGRYPRIHGEALSLSGFDCDVTVHGWDRTGALPKTETLDGVKVERVRVSSSEMRGPLQGFFLIAFWIKTFFKLVFRRVDVVHCHNLDVLPLGYALKIFKGASLVFDAHEPDYYALWPDRYKPLLGVINFVERFFAKRSDSVIVTNDYQQRKFKEIGVEAVQIIGNYPVEDLIVKKIVPEKFRRKKLAFGRIGTIYDDVGIEESAEAFALCDFKGADVSLFLAGRVVDTYKSRLESILAPLVDKVELYGAYKAMMMPELYDKIDVSLMLYRKTDWFVHITPTKFYDSIANGVPVIMTDIGGLGDVIKEYKCGIVVDENDLKGVREAMETLAADVELREGMARNALKLAQDEYNWQRMEEKLDSIYKAL